MTDQTFLEAEGAAFRKRAEKAVVEAAVAWRDREPSLRCDEDWVLAAAVDVLQGLDNAKR